MSNTSFIVIETKNGRATPSSVWEASSEQDYMARVGASTPRIGEEFSDFLEVISQDCERHAMSVEIMNQESFNSFDPADLDHRILATAERLGWYEPEATTDE